MGTDEGWWLTLCLETMGRLPSEMEPLVTAREYTILKARSVVQSAYHKLLTAHAAEQRSAQR